MCGQAEEGIIKNLIYNQMFDFSQTGFSLHYLLRCHIIGLIFIRIFISKHVTCPLSISRIHFKPTSSKLCVFKISQNLT